MKGQVAEKKEAFKEEWSLIRVVFRYGFHCLLLHKTANLGFIDEFLKRSQLHLSKDRVVNVCHVAHCLQEDGGGIDVLLQGGQGFGTLLLLVDTQVDVLHQLL